MILLITMKNLINKIHNNDCMNILKQIPDKTINLVIADPPYNITKLKYDKNIFNLDAWFIEILRIIKDNGIILLFASGKFFYKIANSKFNKYLRYELIWDKSPNITGFLDCNTRPLTQHEFILYFSKSFFRPNNKNVNCLYNTYNHNVQTNKNNIKENGIYSISGSKRKIYKKINNKKHFTSILKFKKYNNIHPSEKPYNLIYQLIMMYSNENDIVLDTFSGSGITSFVCKMTNRCFIATEIDYDFYKLSINRMNNDLFTTD